MPLVPVEFDSSPLELPGDIVAFLREADDRIERFRLTNDGKRFVPSDYAPVYAALKSVCARGLATGNAFCEWGSGFGVVACLGASVGYEACGIEIEHDLHDESVALAEAFDFDVELVCGSLIPVGGEQHTEVEGQDFGWLSDGGSDAYAELGLGVEDFDLIFAYPWPGEEEAITNIFETFAAKGALLLTYHGIEDMQLRRLQ